jgi:hypothetical protein
MSVKRDVEALVDDGIGGRCEAFPIDELAQGEAPCPASGITYGNRESRDVLAAYTFLTGKHDTVYAMGSSVGASSILIGLPKCRSSRA